MKLSQDIVLTIKEHLFQIKKLSKDIAYDDHIARRQIQKNAKLVIKNANEIIKIFISEYRKKIQ